MEQAIIKALEIALSNQLGCDVKVTKKETSHLPMPMKSQLERMSLIYDDIHILPQKERV